MWKDKIQMTHACRTFHTIVKFYKGRIIAIQKGVNNDHPSPTFRFHPVGQKNNLSLSFFENFYNQLIEDIGLSIHISDK